MVLYVENAIIPINVSETMSAQEIVGELQTKNWIVDRTFAFLLREVDKSHVQAFAEVS